MGLKPAAFFGFRYLVVSRWHAALIAVLLFLGRSSCPVVFFPPHQFLVNIKQFFRKLSISVSDHVGQSIRAAGQ